MKNDIISYDNINIWATLFLHLPRISIIISITTLLLTGYIIMRDNE